MRGIGGFMRKAVRIFLSCAACVALLCAMAQASTKDKNKDKSKTAEHHSRISKVAFWRHHKDSDNKKISAKATGSKVAQTSKPPASKQGQAKTAQLKPVSAKAGVAKKDQKPAVHPA